MVKIVKMEFLLAAMLIVATLLGGSAHAMPGAATQTAAAEHGIIRINNDTELEELANASGWQGNGSAGNPYVIENYVIDAHGNTSAIFIGNVSEYVVIRNCTVYNVSAVQSYGWGSGVMIYRSSNVVIENLTAHDVVQYGLYIGTDSNNVVVKNSHFYPGNMSYIAGITVSGRGDVLINNTINGSSTGIWIHSGYYTELYSNRINGSSILIDNGFYADRYVIPANNTVNGKPVLYITGFRNNQSVDASNAGEVILGGVSWVSVRGLNINDTGSAYLLLKSNNVSIENSVITNSSAYAVLSQNSRDIVLDNLCVSGSGRVAMNVIYTSNFTVRNTTIKGTGVYQYGVYGFGVSGLHLINATVSGATTGIYAYGTTSRNITVRGSRINVSYHGYGIYINSGSTSTLMKNVKLENNALFNAAGYDAIHILSITDAIIANNTITGDFNSSNGIYLAGFSTAVSVKNNSISGQRTGIDLASAYSNTVLDNKIFSNLYTGISMYTSSNNLIAGNMINSSGSYGIMLGTNSKSNVIRNNCIGNSTMYGIYMQSTTEANRIYNNSLYFNHGSNHTHSASHVQAYDASGKNFWNTTAPSGGRGYGNYWYDWNSTDPYIIDGNAGAQDYFPLTSAPAVPELSALLPLLLAIILLFVTLRRRR